MTTFDRHQFHLDTAERHGGPVTIECRPVWLPGCTVETLTIGSSQFFGGVEHLRRIRDAIDARLAQLETDAIAAELWRREREAEFPPPEGVTTEVDPGVPAPAG